MPDDTAVLRTSPVREDALSSVVTELLQLVGLHAASEPEEAAASGYGKGLDTYGFADYAKAAIPSKLKQIVEAANPTMIRSADWSALADHQAAAAESTRRDMKALMQAVPTCQTDAEECSAAMDKLIKGATQDKEVDLGKFGKIAPRDIETKWGELSQQLAAAQKKAAEAEQKLKASLVMSPDRAATALRLADDPRNNPERDQVTKALKQLEVSTAKLTTASPKQQASAQYTQLNEVQKVLFAWNDRRTRENLPPSAEALALGDLVQRMQRETIKGIAERGDDLPLPAGLDPTEAAAAQRSWKNMCNSGTPDWTPSKGDRINVPVPTAEQAAACKSGITPDQAKQFRVETLSNFAELMQTDAGRSLVNKLNAGEHKVSILPGDSMLKRHRTGDTARRTVGRKARVPRVKSICLPVDATAIRCFRPTTVTCSPYRRRSPWGTSWSMPCTTVAARTGASRKCPTRK